MRNTYIFILWLVLFLGVLGFNLYFPFLQSRFPRLNAPTPGGAFVQTEWPVFSTKAWLKGDYQKNYELAYKQQHPSSAFVLRQRNEWLWQYFHDMGNEKIIPGQNNYLFSKDYTDALVGIDFVGETAVNKVVEQLKKLNDLLSKQGKTFIVMMPPGQARAYHHLAPAPYNQVADSSNWLVYSQMLKNTDVPFFNFEYLLEKRATDTYQYFPQLGLHWNMYGATKSMEQVCAYIEQVSDFNLPTIVYEPDTKEQINDVETDLDLFYGANLFKMIEQHEFPVPLIRYHSDSTTVRPNVLVVGDSFYELLYKQKTHENLFDPNSSFWYYNSKVSPQGGFAYQLNLKEQIASRDIIMLVVAEWNLNRVGWGFLEQLEAALQ